MRLIKSISLLVCLTLSVPVFAQSTWCCWQGMEFTIISAENAKSEMNSADLISSQTSYFELHIIDATKNEPFPQGTGMVVSVKFSNVKINVTTTQLYQRFGVFGNLVSERWGIAYSSNLPWNQGIQSVNLNYTVSDFNDLKIPIDAGLITRTIPDKFLNDHYTYTLKSYVFQFDATVEIRAANYEPRTIFLTNVMPPATEDVGLVQQIDNVNLKGSINVNNVNGTSDKMNKSNNLDILTPQQIAEALGLPESEVMGLINKQQLKAKKIGDKYFIRKEDFDAFMKK